MTHQKQQMPSWTLIALTLLVTIPAGAMDQQQTPPPFTPSMNLDAFCGLFRDELAREREKTQCAEQKATTVENERHKLANEIEILRSKVKFMDTKIGLWRTPGILFFVIGVPICSITVYRWLKRKGYIGARSDNDETQQLIANAEEANDDIPSIERVG